MEDPELIDLERYASRTEAPTMSLHAIAVERPKRWDHPLDASFHDDDVHWLLGTPPFSLMNERRFASHASLASIIRNDCRLLRLDGGDVLFREGQYGGSAYLVLTGTIRIFLSKLLLEDSRADEQSSRFWSGGKWLTWFRQQCGRTPPANDSPSVAPGEIGYRGEGLQTRIFIQDLPGVLSQHATSAVGPGEMFGEMAAVTRSPREYTAVAEDECLVLEVRWQGLKLLRQDPQFRKLLDERYRSEVLRTHLRETELFRFIPESSLAKIVAATRLESFGELEWYAIYHRQAQANAAQRMATEPMVAEEGSYVAGLWIVRGGFARLSRRQGAGHRTLAYLGKGQLYGFDELAHNWRQAESVAPLPYQTSLRAIGYIDALCIPRQVVYDHVLPFVRIDELPKPIATPRYQFGQPVMDAPLGDDYHEIETGLLEFLVDHRIMNGRQTMIIDTDRCTRCDDCVKACASTHGGTPVFERRGPQYGPWLFAQACMHCEDPVCMIGCPTGAIHREEETGLIRINASTCIGCKSCAESCPYDNIRMVDAIDSNGRVKIEQSTGLPILAASKCDFCRGNASRPVCQAACPHDALVRMNMSDLKGIGRWQTRQAS